jgi:hypothetical protein
MAALADPSPLAFSLSPFFWKGLLVIICSFILFVGSVYLLLAAVFGLRMAYLVSAVSFFGWMIIFSVIWVVGSPGSTPTNQGPRGYEPRWQVFAAGTGTVASQHEATRAFPASPWKAPSGAQTNEVDTIRSAIQKYLAAEAADDLRRQGQQPCPEAGAEAETGGETVGESEGTSAATSSCFTVDPLSFTVQDVKFADAGGTDLAGAHGFYSPGGVEVTVFAYFDEGNVPKYSWAFLIGSILGFVVHLPFLDRAERKRKEILTGGTAPPWFGPA